MASAAASARQWPTQHDQSITYVSLLPSSPPSCCLVTFADVLDVCTLSRLASPTLARRSSSPSSTRPDGKPSPKVRLPPSPALPFYAPKLTDWTFGPSRPLFLQSPSSHRRRICRCRLRTLSSASVEQTTTSRSVVAPRPRPPATLPSLTYPLADSTPTEPFRRLHPPLHAALHLHRGHHPKLASRHLPSLPPLRLFLLPDLLGRMVLGAVSPPRGVRALGDVCCLCGYGGAGGRGGDAAR